MRGATPNLRYSPCCFSSHETRESQRVHHLLTSWANRDYSVQGSLIWSLRSPVLNFSSLHLGILSFTSFSDNCNVQCRGWSAFSWFALIRLFSVTFHFLSFAKLIVRSFKSQPVHRWHLKLKGFPQNFMCARITRSLRYQKLNFVDLFLAGFWPSAWQMEC